MINFLPEACTALLRRSDVDGDRLKDVASLLSIGFELRQIYLTSSGKNFMIYCYSGKR